MHIDLKDEKVHFPLNELYSQAKAGNSTVQLRTKRLIDKNTIKNLEQKIQAQEK